MNESNGQPTQDEEEQWRKLGYGALPAFLSHLERATVVDGVVQESEARNAFFGLEQWLKEKPSIDLENFTRYLGWKNKRFQHTTHDKNGDVHIDYIDRRAIMDFLRAVTAVLRTIKTESAEVGEFCNRVTNHCKASGFDVSEDDIANATWAAGPAARAQKPKTVTIYPVRDATGKILRFVSGSDFAAAVATVFQRETDLSVTVDFPLAGFAGLERFKTCEVVQRADVSGWVDKSNRGYLVWEAIGPCLLSDSVLHIKNGDLTFDRIENVTLVVFRYAPIVLNGAVTRSHITIGDYMPSSSYQMETGSPTQVTVFDVFQDSVMKLVPKKSAAPSKDAASSQLADARWHAKVIFAGDKAKAVGSTFINILPVDEREEARLSSGASGVSCLPEIRGERFERCSFEGLRGEYICIATAETSFLGGENTGGETPDLHLYLSGDNSKLHFEAVQATLHVTSGADCSSLSATNGANLSLVADDTKIVLKNAHIEDSVIEVKGGSVVEAGGGTYHTSDSVVFEDIGQLDISGCTFRDCYVVFKKVDKIVADGCHFIGCTIDVVPPLDSNPAHASRMSLAGTQIAGSMLKTQAELAELNLTNAEIIAGTSLQGRVKKLIAKGAQLGGLAGARTSVKWDLFAANTVVDGMQLGNVIINDAAQFGRSPKAGWKSVKVVGALDLGPKAAAIFDLLSLAENLEGERSTSDRRDATVKAKTFNLG